MIIRIWCVCVCVYVCKLCVVFNCISLSMYIYIIIVCISIYTHSSFNKRTPRAWYKSAVCVKMVCLIWICLWYFLPRVRRYWSTTQPTIREDTHTRNKYLQNKNGRGDSPLPRTTTTTSKNVSNLCVDFCRVQKSIDIRCLHEFSLSFWLNVILVLPPWCKTDSLPERLLMPK